MPNRTRIACGPATLIQAAACLLMAACNTTGTSTPPQATTTHAPTQTARPASTCPTTSPPKPAFVPPEPYPARPPNGLFWYGTPGLWTMLKDDGLWNRLPQTASGFTMKLMWWRQGYRMDAEPLPALTVTGRRLDAPSPALITDQATNASSEFGEAMLLGVEIPATGCWEFTGHYRGHELSFIVQVNP